MLVCQLENKIYSIVSPSLHLPNISVDILRLYLYSNCSVDLHRVEAPIVLLRRTGISLPAFVSVVKPF